MNRVAAGKRSDGKEAACGKCKTVLAGKAVPLTLTDGNFLELVERSPLPVMVDMWAPWCGPCRMVGPVVDEIAAEMGGLLRVGKMNVDENAATSSLFSIRSIPALLFFQGGKEVDRIVGAQGKREIMRRIERILG